MSKKRGAAFRGKHDRRSAAEREKARLIGISALVSRLGPDQIEGKERTFQESASTTTRAEMLLALSELKTGEIDETRMAHLASAGNMAMVLAEMGLGAEYLAGLLRNQQVLADIAAQRDRTRGMYSANGDQLDSLAWMVSVHDDQLLSPDLTDALVERARRMVHARKMCGDLLPTDRPRAVYQSDPASASPEASAKWT